MHPTRKLLAYRKPPPPPSKLTNKHKPSLPRSTYYEADQRQGASLIRARKPFLVKNLVTGVAMFGLTACIYVYTIRAVAQDEFEDVVVPDASAGKK